MPLTHTEALVSIAQTVLRNRISQTEPTRVDIINAINSVWQLIPEGNQNAAFVELCQRYNLNPRRTRKS
jgi:hypothetical protein